MPEINASAVLSSGHRPMGFAEFVIVIAAIMALNPLAMDMMLPALRDIAKGFNLIDPNRPQFVLTAFTVGFGLGQFVTGPLSDRFGRRPVLLGGLALYCVASLVAVAARSFEALILARALQGLGTSATRVIATSIVRDCYVGRRMASVMSLAMMVFVSVPIVAPAFGQAVMLLTQWRGIFVALMLCGIAVLVWSALRVPETLPPVARKPLTAGNVLAAYRRTITSRQTLFYALAAAGVQGTMFAFLLSSQQLFVETFGLGAWFPLAFAGIATGVAIAGFLNARLVGRLGMRVMSHAALLGFVAVAATMMVLARMGLLSFPVFMGLSVLVTFGFGLMFANFTAIAMEPHALIAGTASSLYGSITTLIGIGAGTLIGQSYDGTAVPLSTGYVVCTLASLAAVLAAERGRLFGSGAAPAR